MARRLSLLRPRLIDRHEVAWRARTLARTQAQRAAARFRRPQWNRTALGDVLAAGVLDGAGYRALDAENWDAVQSALLAHLRERPSRFVLDHHSREQLASRVRASCPQAPADAAARADQILAGRHDLLGFTNLSFSPPSPTRFGETGGGERIDWHRDPVHDKRAPAMFWADVPYLDPKIVGDHKIIWELNRHQYWLQLGRALWLTRESKYSSRIVEDLESWLAANPPLRGINWASMLELGLRSISWTWGLHFLLGAIENSEFEIRNSQLCAGTPWLVDMLVGIDRQLRHVEQNLSYYFSPNTHLTGEALALYVVGLALPELAASTRWVDLGRTILLREIDRQVLADGGHAERSTHYHRYTLDFYLLALLTAMRADGEPVAVFTEAVERLAGFARALADDRGVLPVIGDDDGGMLWPITGRDCRDVRDSLALAAAILGRPELAPWGVQEEAYWVGGDLVAGVVRPFHLSTGARGALSEVEGQGRGGEPRRGEPKRLALHDGGSETFPETGYVVMRDGAGNHAVFDVGAHGYMNGGHAHADALAITIATVQGPLLIDPGTSSYTLDARLRDRMRSTRSHNTLEIDGRPQSVPSGPFHWRTRTDAHLHATRHNGAFDWAEASHDGYGDVRHRRSVVRSKVSGWLIADEVLGNVSHSASAFWHFDPEWTVVADAPGRLRAVHQSGAVRWLLHDGEATRLARGDQESGLGWCAPVYGSLLPTWSATVTREGNVPFSLVTWIGGPPDLKVRPTYDDVARGRVGEGGRPALEPVQATCDGIGQAIAARIVDGQRSSLFVIRSGESQLRQGRATAVAEYQTDARVLHCAVDSGRFVALDLIEATHALGLAEGLITISSEEVIGDLHLELHDDVLELCSSEPPPRITLQGDAIGRLVVDATEWTSSYSRFAANAS